MPADLGAVKMRLEVDQVCKAVPAVQGVIHHIGHQQRVKLACCRAPSRLACTLWSCELWWKACGLWSGA